MNGIQASQFKAKCPALTNAVAPIGESPTIARNGKPVAALAAGGRKGNALAGLQRGAARRKFLATSFRRLTILGKQTLDFACRADLQRLDATLQAG